MQKNLKLIDRIKKYQKFFEKLEKKQKFKNKKSALNAFRGVPGARALFNEEGELDLTVEDIKQGKKLDTIERLGRTTKGEEMIEAKMNYYKNMKPKGFVFKTQEMDPAQQIIQ